MADYESFMHRWFEEVWNQGREEAIDELFAADGVAHGLKNAQGETVRGQAEFKELFRSFRQAFPNIRITVDETVTEGDRIAARCTVRAVHEGEGLGIAATKQPVEFTGMAIVHLKDGKIAEAWNEFDFLQMYTQVGAVGFITQ